MLINKENDMKIKTSNSKYKVAIIGEMSNEMNAAFESNLKAVFEKFGKKIANIVIDTNTGKHYKMVITAKSGATENVTFSTTNRNTVKIYMSYVTKFLKTA